MYIHVLSTAIRCSFYTLVAQSMGEHRVKRCCKADGSGACRKLHQFSAFAAVRLSKGPSSESVVIAVRIQH